MKYSRNPIRLFAEILGIVALSEAVVMLVMPMIASGVSVWTEGLLDVVLLVLLSGPAVYWRVMGVTRNAAPVGRPERARAVATSVRSAVVMTAVAQVLGLALTAGGVWWQQRSIETEAQVRFDRAVDRLEVEVRRRLDSPVFGLTGIRAAYAASDDINHTEFRELVQTLDITRQFPGVRGFGIVERVPRAELDRYVAQQQARGMPDFHVTSPGQSADLYVVKHIEPLESNFETWGSDQGRELVRREALERAALSGEASLSGRMTLVRDGVTHPGFLYALPVYRKGTDPATGTQRMAALEGLLYAPMVAAEVMDGAAGVAQEAVQVELFDGDVRLPGNLLFDGISQLVTLNGATPHGDEGERMFQTTRTLPIGGRYLNLRVSSSPAFVATLDRSSVAMMTVSGAFGSFMLALAVWLLASGRMRAQNLAKRMTAELDTMARVVQTTDNAVIITDAQLHITWVNDGFTRMTGYTLADALGRTPNGLLGSGKTDPATIEALTQAAHAGEPCRAEVINRTKDGREYWLNTDVQPTRNDLGQLVGFMQIGTDITAQKQTELELLKAQRHMTELAYRLNLAVEGGSDGLWDWMDLKEDAQWWSPSYYKLLGYTPADIPASAKAFLSIVHPDHHARLYDASQRTIHHGEPYDQEMLLRTKDQGYRWFRSRAKVFRDTKGDAIRMAGSAQDIHDRKQAEAEVRQVEALLRGSIDALDDAYVLYDPQDRLVLCNQRHKDFYPLAADVIVPGNTFEFIIRTAAARSQYTHAKGREEAWIAERLAQHRQPQSNFQQVLEDGRILRIVERRMPDGHSVGFRVDITDFIRATEAAEAASRSKSQFLANMSHEIRTPMNAILGMLRLLQNTDLTDRQKDYAGKTEGAARSLLGLLNDILDFSKVEAGKMTLDPHPFRLDKLLRDLSVILSSNVGSKDVEVLFDVDPSVPRGLVGDDMRLQQVLINLGGNAIKFTSQGEVVLRLRALEQTDQDVLLEFSVKDSGIGIAPENQAHIFSGFSQAEASTTRRFGGTGLGLAISNRLVKLLGGDLHLVSAPGQGSTFSFQIRMGLASQADAAQAVPPPQTHGQRTLIVDDNAVARELMGSMVQAMGWQVDTAGSGAQALELVQQGVAAGKPYEVIFLDWLMPEMDGWETLERVGDVYAGKPRLPPPVVIMVTAHGREMLEEKEAKGKTALSGFLVKPVTASMLLDAVMNGKSAGTQKPSTPSPKASKPRRLQGMRLLVVEDNKINQAVAQGLLSQEGAIITLADNGRLGVNAVLTMQPAYDAVLMDLQMPVMDGFEATRTIRKELGLTHLPIIAMTANAMASDREDCLAAGMNDHVGKPFELDHLVSVLIKHTGFSLPVDAAMPAVAVASATPAAGIEHPPGDLDVAGALARFGGNTAMYSSVLGAFARDMVQVPDQVHGHLRADQHADAVRALHTLKGLAATVGARHLAAVAARLEHKVRQGLQPQAHQDLVATLRNAIDALANTLVPVLQQYQAMAEPTAVAGAAAPLDRQKFQRDLQSLATLLKNSDMVALEAHALIRRTFGASAGQALKPLDAAMASLDFATAQTVCATLISGLEAGQ